MTAEERETIISWDDGAETVTVYTASRPMMNKLHKLAEANPEQVKLKRTGKYQGETIDETWELPSKKWISVRKPKEVSEEMRERMREMSAKFGFKSKTASIEAVPNDLT